MAGGVRYVILLAYDPAVWEQADEQTQQAFFASHEAFEAYIEAHGERIASAALCDAGVATTVRPGASVTDGPFVELTEQLAGYYDVRLPSLDAAIEAAGLLHPDYSVEIRPVMAIEGFSQA